MYEEEYASIKQLVCMEVSMEKSYTNSTGELSPCLCGCAGVVFKDILGKACMSVVISISGTTSENILSRSFLDSFMTARPVLLLLFGEDVKAEVCPVWSASDFCWVGNYVPTEITSGCYARWKCITNGIQLLSPIFEIRSKPNHWIACFPNGAGVYSTKASSLFLSKQLSSIVGGDNVTIIARRNVVLIQVKNVADVSHALHLLCKPHVVVRFLSRAIAGLRGHHMSSINSWPQPSKLLVVRSTTAFYRSQQIKDVDTSCTVAGFHVEYEFDPLLDQFTSNIEIV